LYTTGHAERAGKVGEKQRRRQLLKELKRDVLMQKRYKNARRLTRPRPGFLVFSLKLILGLKNHQE
jgi:hypothetical protein